MTREAEADRAKVLNIGRELSTTTDRLKKLLSDVTKLRRTDYDELATQHRDSKSEPTRVKKEMTRTKKRVQDQDQLELTLAHKERMKTRKLRGSASTSTRPKINNYTKLLAEEHKHLNTSIL
jgi:hypothetical protein